MKAKIDAAFFAHFIYFLCQHIKKQSYNYQIVAFFSANLPCDNLFTSTWLHTEDKIKFFLFLCSVASAAHSVIFFYSLTIMIKFMVELHFICNINAIQFASIAHSRIYKIYESISITHNNIKFILSFQLKATIGNRKRLERHTRNKRE